MEILLSHGGGGKRTRELIEKVFLKYFENEKLSELGDSALFDATGGQYAFTTDSYVVNPLFFPGGDIGKLAVSGTVNDLSASGAEPLYLSAAFIIEEGFALEDLEKIVSSMSRTASEVGIPVITGDTKVVERGKADGLFINTSGIGRLYRTPPPSPERIEPGDVLLVSGTIGDHGITVMALREKILKDPGDLQSDCAPLWGLVKSVLDTVDVKFMRDPTRGGLAAVANEIVRGKSFGLNLYEEKVPVKEAVRGLSEILGIDPLLAANEGKMVFVVGREEAQRALDTMRSHPLGKDSSIIGEFTDEAPGKVILVTAYGTRRILEMPQGEQLPRIC